MFCEIYSSISIPCTCSPSPFPNQWSPFPTMVHGTSVSPKAPLPGLVVFLYFDQKRKPKGRSAESTHGSFGNRFPQNPGATTHTNYQGQKGSAKKQTSFLLSFPKSVGKFSPFSTWRYATNVQQCFSKRRISSFRVRITALGPSYDEDSLLYKKCILCDPAGVSFSSFFRCTYGGAATLRGNN